MRRKQFWLTWVNCQNILMRKIRWLIFALSVKVGLAYLGQFDLGPSLKQWWLWRFKLGLGPYHMIFYRSVPEWAVLCNNVKIKLPWAKWADHAALARDLFQMKWRILNQTGEIGSGKNTKFLFFLLGLKYTLRTCFESKNFSSNSCPELSNQVLSFSEGQIY